MNVRAMRVTMPLLLSIAMAVACGPSSSDDTEADTDSAAVRRHRHDAGTPAPAPEGGTDAAAADSGVVINVGTTGNTISSASCSQADVQAAINAALAGDTVRIPGGTCAWSGAVSIPSTKGLTLDGGKANITSGTLNVSQSSTTTTRITNFAFSGTHDWQVGPALSVDGSSSSAPFRLDHNAFSGGSGSMMLVVSGNSQGVIDHNAFSASNNAEMIHNMGMGATDPSGWMDDVAPGGSRMVFIEDNTFTNDSGSAYFYGCSVVQSYYGARTVFRHNNVFYCQVDQHGTPGMIGARWWEIYENIFQIPAGGGNQSNYMQIRAGSGVIFNNHESGGTNTGGGGIELVEEDVGYPALYQVGRGKNQVLDAAYVWGNDSSMSVGSGSSNVQVGRDYYVASKPGYAPYTYPHPMAYGQ